MARLFWDGFEHNSLVNAGYTVSGTTAIVTSPVRSGTYAFQSKPTSAASRALIQFGSASLKTAYFRFAYYVVAHPANNIAILNITDAGAVNFPIRIRSTGSGIKAIDSAGGQIGSSQALNTGQYYVVELKVFSDASAGTVDMWVDGVNVVSATGLNTAGNDIQFMILGTSTSDTHEWYMDDVGVNDTTGSFQNGRLGNVGKIVRLSADSAGDSNGFLVQVGGTVGSANNYTRINEIPANDATSYNASATLNTEDLYNFAASGIGAGDTISLVAVGARYANIVAADAATALKIELMKTSGGTKTQSSALIPNTTTWRNIVGTGAQTYPIITYQDPDSGTWTQTTLDSLQAGMIISTGGTNAIGVTNLWVEFEYVPALSINVSDTATTSESTAINTFKINTSDNIAILDVRTNLITNPSFESAATFWSQGNAGNITGLSFNLQDTTNVLFGSSAASFQSAVGQYYLNVISAVSLTVGLTYTFSAYVFVPTGSSITAITIYFKDVNNNVSLSSAVPSVTPGQWTRISTTYTATVANSSVLLIIADPVGTDSTHVGTWWVDGTMLENSSTLNPYFDGSGMNTQWTGAANASTSTLNPSLTIGNITIKGSDAVVTSEQQAINTFKINVSDAVTTSEYVVVADFNPSTTFVVPVREYEAVTENVQLQQDCIVRVSDTVSTSEGVVILVPTYPISVNDTSTLSESIGISIAESIVAPDTITIAESPKVSLESNISLVDSSTLSDSISVGITNNIVASDNIAISELVAAQLVLLVSVSESISISESAAIYIPVLFIVTNDQTTLSESLATIAGGSIAVTETITASESVSIQNNIADLAISDSLAINESVTGVVSMGIATSDVLGTSETVSVNMPILISSSDTTITGELVLCSVQLVIAVSDSIAATDSSQTVLVSSILVVDNVHINEFYKVAGLGYELIASDTLSATEAVNAIIVQPVQYRTIARLQFISSDAIVTCFTSRFVVTLTVATLIVSEL